VAYSSALDCRRGLPRRPSSEDVRVFGGLTGARCEENGWDVGGDFS